MARLLRDLCSRRQSVGIIASSFERTRLVACASCNVVCEAVSKNCRFLEYGVA